MKKDNNKYLEHGLTNDKSKTAIANTLLLLPFLVVFLLFTVVPVVVTIVTSFTDKTLLETANFVGFSNYINLIQNDGIFLDAVRNTLMFVCICAPLCFALSVFLAFLLFKTSRRVARILLIVLHAPLLGMGLYAIIEYIFSSEITGFLNSLIVRNFSPIDFQSSHASLVLIFLIELWLCFGSGFLTIYYGMRQLPREYTDAHQLEGFLSWKSELFEIIIPMVKPYLLLTAVLQLAVSFGVGGSFLRLSADSTTMAAYARVLYGEGEIGYSSAVLSLLYIVMIVAYLAIKRLFYSWKGQDSEN